MRETPANYVFPWALVYEYPVPDEPKFCRIVEEQWTEDGLRAEPYASSLGCCPHANEPDHDKSLCPFGFWGLAHIVEQPISPITKMTDEDPARDVGRKLHSRTPLSLSVAATQDASLNSKTLTQHIKDIGLIPKISILMPVANDWTKVGQILANPELVYILCHGEYDKVQGTPYLGIGPRDDLELHKIFPDKLINLLRTMGTAAIWKETGPIIFINGCHTTNLSPGDIFDFVSPFAAIGATGVIGTEISVDLNVAVEFATSLMTHLAQGHSVCEAIRFVRWSLVNKGNLLGLAYTPYCLADLAVSFDR